MPDLPKVDLKLPTAEKVVERPSMREQPAKATLYLCDEAKDRLREITRSQGISQQEFLRFEFNLAVESYGMEPVEWPEDRRRLTKEERAALDR